MNQNPEAFSGVPQAAAPRFGFAIASLVLGILALVLSLFLVGAILGVVGLIFGIVQLRGRAGGRGMAWFGVALSVLGILGAVGFGAFYHHAYQQFRAAMESTDSGASATEWEGTLAPDITVTTLDGETIQLSQLRGKRVVLDFWATWCPPCVREIPHFLRLYGESSRDQLVVVGISSESESAVKPFIKKQGINYPIALAKDEDLPSPYKDIESIPTTFFIDRNGVIQTVAIGYHDFAALKEYALAGDFQGQPKPPPTNALSELKPAVRPLKLAEAWRASIPGATALAVGDWDGATEILVASSDKRLHVLSPGGAEKATLSLPDGFRAIEIGRRKTRGARLLGYSNWGRKVSVMDTQGRELWSYSAALGVDGAHWGDLDGDGTDELVVGLNGSGGLHAVSADGKKLWGATDLGNVWNQAVISARENRPALILATEAGGTVRVYDAQGKLQRTIRPEGKYCAQMTARVVDTNGAVQGITAGEGRIIAFDTEGRVAWSTAGVKNSGGWRTVTFAAGDLNGDGQCEWVFAESSGELVVANPLGEKLASLPGTADAESFDVVPAENGAGLLIVLSGSTVRAFACGPTENPE